MKNRSLKRKALTAGTALLAICLIAVTPVLFFAGCSSNPVTPEASYFDQPFVDPGTAGSSLSAGKLFETYSGSGTISSKDGGSIDINMPGTIHEFNVEAGSIENDVTIDINVLFIDFFGSVVGIFDFSPDGQMFSESAELRFDGGVLGNGVSELKLYWLNENTNRWEYQGTYNADSNNRIKIPIDHFSKYGVSD